MKSRLRYLNDLPHAAALVEAVRPGRAAAFGARLSAWGIAPAAAQSVADRKYAEALAARIDKLLPGYKSGDRLPPDADLAHHAAEFAEKPCVRDIPLAFELLAAIEKKEGFRFRAVAQRILRDPALAGEVTSSAFDEVREYRLTPGMEADAVSLAGADREAHSRLHDRLLGCFWQVTRRRAIDALRRHTLPGGALARCSVIDIDARIRVAEFDKAVLMRPEFSLTERHFWKWKKENPDTEDNQFPGGLNSNQIHRVKAGLARKLMRWEHGQHRATGKGEKK